MLAPDAPRLAARPRQPYACRADAAARAGLQAVLRRQRGIVLKVIQRSTVPSLQAGLYSTGCTVPYAPSLLHELDRNTS